MKVKPLFLLMLLAMIGTPNRGVLEKVWAETSPSSSQPYIDKLKKTMEPQKENGGGNQPFIDSIKKDLPAEKSDGKTYIERLKASDPENKKEVPAESFLETEKRKLDKKEERPSAIGAVKDGKSELEMKRPGVIHTAVGARLGFSNSHKITAKAASKAEEFFSVYRDTWVPDLTLFGEYQPFHSEWYGNVGLLGSIGFSQFKGTGQFAIPNLSYGTTSFGAGSKTKFTFNIIPVEIGGVYRFNLLRLVRPYVSAGALGVIFFESRDDGLSGHKGKSFGFTGSVGVAILLDFISRSTTWEAYEERGVKHTYLTLEYNKTKTTSGDVQFDNSGYYAGFTFEM